MKKISITKRKISNIVIFYILYFMLTTVVVAQKIQPTQNSEVGRYAEDGCCIYIDESTVQPFMSWVVDDNDNEGPGGFTWWSDNTDLLMYLSQTDRSLMMRHGGFKSQNKGLSDWSTLRLIADNDNSGDGDIVFGNGGDFNSFTERMRMKTNGNFGIGTKNPNSKLHVNGKIIAGSASGTSSFTIEATGSSGPYQVPAIGVKNNTNGAYLYMHGGGPALIFKGSSLRFGTESDVGVGWSEKMRLKNNGNLGIGTTEPKSGLHVKDLNGITTESDGVKIQIDVNIDKTAGWIGTASNHGLYLGTNNNNNNNAINMYLDTSDNVYVGGLNENSVSATFKAKYDLFVEEGILAEDLTIGAKQYWADYVFSEEYKLVPLAKLAKFIKKNNHLPNIPSDEIIAKDGYSMHDMNVLFLEKIEELTLYTIEQQKLIENLKEEVEIFKRTVRAINGKENTITKED